MTSTVTANSANAMLTTVLPCSTGSDACVSTRAARRRRREREGLGRGRGSYRSPLHPRAERPVQEPLIANLITSTSPQPTRAFIDAALARTAFERSASGADPEEEGEGELHHLPPGVGVGASGAMQPAKSSKIQPHGHGMPFTQVCVGTLYVSPQGQAVNWLAGAVGVGSGVVVRVFVFGSVGEAPQPARTAARRTKGRGDLIRAAASARKPHPRARGRFAGWSSRSSPRGAVRTRARRRSYSTRRGRTRLGDPRSRGPGLASRPLLVLGRRDIRPGTGLTRRRSRLGS